MPGHSDSVTCIGFNHDASLIVTGDMAGVIKVWSVDCHQLVWSYDVDDLEASIYCYYLAYAVERCLSVHLSVTRRYCV